MTEDWFAGAVERVADAGRQACLAIEKAVGALQEGCEARNAGRSIVEVVDELIAAGGRETRLSAADAFREYERAIASMRAGVVRALVDEGGLSLTDVAKRLKISRQAAARLYEPVPERGDEESRLNRTKGLLTHPGVRTDASFMTTSSLSATPGPDVGVVRFDGAVLDRQYAEMIAESIPHIVWTASPDGATTYFNRQGTDYTGCPRETNYEWNWVTLVHPEDAERAAQAWQHATMTGTDYLLEYRIRRFDGVFRWHAFRAIPLRDAAGEIDLWIGTATDCEDQKQLELALRRAEREATQAVTLLQSIEAATPIGFKLVDRDLRVVRINQMLAEIDGRSVEECIGRTVSELVPDLWPQLENIYRRALAGDTISNVDVSKPRAADPHRMRHWLASYYPVRIDGETIGVGNVVVDITERKEAEEFRAVVMDNMAEGLYALDADGLVTYMNPAAASMLGWTEDELRGKPMHATVHFQRADGSKVPAEECSLLQVRTQGRSVRILDDAFTRKDGSIFPVAYSSAPLRSGPDPPRCRRRLP